MAALYTPAQIAVARLGPDFMPDGANVRVGQARLRIQRVRGDTCIVPQAFSELLPSCYGALTRGNMDEQPWSGLTFDGDLGMPSMTSLRTSTHYPGCGYALDLPDTLEEAAAALQSLQDNGDFEEGVRAMILDFNVYNVHSDTFAVTTALTELLSMGAARSSYKIRTGPLLKPHRVFHQQASSFDAGFLGMELVLYGLVLFYVMAELREYKRVGLSVYLSDTWNKINCVNYACFLTVIGMRMAMIGRMEGIAPDLDQRGRYINLISIADLNMYTDSVNAFNGVLCFIKVFKYTHTNKRLAQFTDTLAVAYAEMVVLTAIIIIVCVGYGLAFTLAFGAYFEEYRNVTESLLSLFESVLGNFDVDKLRDARPVIGTLLFLSFIFLMFFVVVSMFLATVDKAYETVREALGHLDGHLDPMAKDLKRLVFAANKFVRYLEENISEDPEARQAARDEREKKKQERIQLAKQARRAAEERGEGPRRADPALSVLGEEGLAAVKSQLYHMELSQADLGRALTKVLVRTRAINKLYPPLHSHADATTNSGASAAAAAAAGGAAAGGAPAAAVAAAVSFAPEAVAQAAGLNLDVHVDISAVQEEVGGSGAKRLLPQLSESAVEDVPVMNLDDSSHK
eukprot:TRINITY_DN1265_c0_g1_i4.p1 TRINITY_DN1265_c0_g1~~TRINITY_DN1265_c0_g1_i4.p1  ORF type:complete len:627 (-),score=228.93 TRINITY_DN1265_c0_g1_i4:57-1937(-)